MCYKSWVNTAETIASYFECVHNLFVFAHLKASETRFCRLFISYYQEKQHQVEYDLNWSFAASRYNEIKSIFWNQHNREPIEPIKTMMFGIREFNPMLRSLPGISIELQSTANIIDIFTNYLMSCDIRIHIKDYTRYWPILSIFCDIRIHILIFFCHYFEESFCSIFRDSRRLSYITFLLIPFLLDYSTTGDDTISIKDESVYDSNLLCTVSYSSCVQFERLRNPRILIWKVVRASAVVLGWRSLRYLAFTCCHKHKFKISLSLLKR